jgi:hypothetical protein
MRQKSQPKGIRTFITPTGRIKFNVIRDGKVVKSFKHFDDAFTFYDRVIKDQVDPKTMNKREASKIASALGKLAAGIPKRYSKAELQRRRERMRKVGLERARRIRAQKKGVR